MYVNIYMYVCVCMYVYVCLNVSMYVRTYKHIYKAGVFGHVTKLEVDTCREKTFV